MQLEVGGIYEGKVTGITKFGAFVSFEGGQTGMVHISEVAPPSSLRFGTLFPRGRPSK